MPHDSGSISLERISGEQVICAPSKINRMRIALPNSVTYYGADQVRSRMVHFLGGDSLETATCCYLTKGDRTDPGFHEKHSVAELDSLLRAGADIGRSLWDDQSLLVDLDVEYVNFDHPAEAFLNPERIFELQRPVQETIEGLLASCGITPLHLLSGRGHHFVWRVAKSSPAFRRLAALGRGPSSLWATTAQQRGPRGEIVSPDMARAFAGLGVVMEFFAHQVKAIAARRTAIPVELTAVNVGPSGYGREMISIDISAFGDPLPIRTLRAPFSIYLKPWQQRGAITDEVLEELPPIFIIPRGEMTLGQALPMMRDPNLAARLAVRTNTKIPDAGSAMENLIGDYEKSSLRKFHDDFYSQEPEPPERWPVTYDRTPLETWPACGRFILERPNDLLLQPSCILRVVRVLLALGWHPRHIAGLIRSKYERDFGWTQFTGCDPATRADFYVRVFAGLFATGRDDLVDFNCTSAREQGLCFFDNCNDNLLRFRESALHRREHDQLAHRPFNRLLLPTKHF